MAIHAFSTSYCNDLKQNGISWCLFVFLFCFLLFFFFFFSKILSIENKLDALRLLFDNCKSLLLAMLYSLTARRRLGPQTQ